MPTKLFTVPARSMLPTLKIGDRFLVDKVSHLWRPIEAGEVIVFRLPKAPTDIYYVKRVIGLPNDQIDLHPNGNISRNGKIVEQKLVHSDFIDEKNKDRFTLLNENLSMKYQILLLNEKNNRPSHTFNVTNNAYFVLGDNRDRSNDSRFWGLVPSENIVGRVKFIYYSEGAIQFKALDGK